ncbi:MAG: DUF1570 domain-containing protein [Planctomyces sp.]
MFHRTQTNLFDSPAHPGGRIHRLRIQEPACFPLLSVFLAAVMIQSASAGQSAQPVMEVRTSTKVLNGKIVSIDQHEVCLVDRFGRLERLPAAEVLSHRVVSEHYRTAGAADFRDQLKAELPKSLEMTVGSRYIVCGPRGRTETYHSLLQETYRNVERRFRVHGFRTAHPETSLVAVVFASSKDFAEYCRRDGVVWSPGLKGYYSLRTNRIALYESLGPDVRTSMHHHAESGDGFSRTESAPGSADSSHQPNGHSQEIMASVDSMTDTTAATLIHEATHQIGYNIGIHSRISCTPTWVIEGLATVLEAPGMRKSSPHNTLRSRLKPERVTWYQEKLAPRRQLGDLAGMIASDELFTTRTLDAYSQAWAVTYFLTETPSRARQFVTYLQLIESRKSHQPGSAEDRLRDFKSVFGDIARLDVDFVRFMDRIPTSSAGAVAANR